MFYQRSKITYAVANRIHFSDCGYSSKLLSCRINKFYVGEMCEYVLSGSFWTDYNRAKDGSLSEGELSKVQLARPLQLIVL